MDPGYVWNGRPCPFSEPSAELCARRGFLLLRPAAKSRKKVTSLSWEIALPLRSGQSRALWLSDP